MSRQSQFLGRFPVIVAARLPGTVRGVELAQLDRSRKCSTKIGGSGLQVWSDESNLFEADSAARAGHRKRCRERQLLDRDGDTANAKLLLAVVDGVATLADLRQGLQHGLGLDDGVLSLRRHPGPLQRCEYLVVGQRGQ